MLFSPISVIYNESKIMAKSIKVTHVPETLVISSPDILGQLVRAKRTSLGLRLEDCASLCDIGINTLSRIENGNKNTTINAIFKVLQGLGIQLSNTDSSANKQNDPWV